MRKVSIIIPVYNAESTLSRTISSVISQQYSNLELILINDGSTDSSLDICLSYASIDPRIIVKSQSNKGVSSARNSGLSLATGHWIYFLDSDDHLNQDFFSKLSPFLDDELIDIIQFGSVAKYSNKTISYRQSLNNGSKIVTSSFREFLQHSKIGALCVWLHLIKRDVLLKHNLSFSEDMRHNEDMLFMYQVLVNSSKYIFIGESIHTQILVPNSLSRSPMNDVKVNNRLLLVERVLQLVHSNPNHVDSIVYEANQLLKGFFGSIAFYIIEADSKSRKDSALKSQKLNTINKNYKHFYKRNKRLLKGVFPKIANIHILYVAYPLKYKISIKLKLRNS